MRAAIRLTVHQLEGFVGGAGHVLDLRPIRIAPQRVAGQAGEIQIGIVNEILQSVGGQPEGFFAEGSAIARLDAQMGVVLSEQAPALFEINLNLAFRLQARGLLSLRDNDRSRHQPADNRNAEHSAKTGSGFCVGTH